MGYRAALFGVKARFAVPGDYGFVLRITAPLLARLDTTTTPLLLTV